LFYENSDSTWFFDLLGGQSKCSCLSSYVAGSSYLYIAYDENFVKKYFPKAVVRASFLQKFPAFLRNRKNIFCLHATAPETFDLRDFDLIISSSNSFAKGIITRSQTKHICYCHSPARFVWDWHYNYLNEHNVGRLKKLFVVPMLHYIRMWDAQSSSRLIILLPIQIQPPAELRSITAVTRRSYIRRWISGK